MTRDWEQRIKINMMLGLSSSSWDMIKYGVIITREKIKETKF